MRAMLCLASLIGFSAHAQKTDVIYLENGDRVTGEIRELLGGQLRLKTDTFGTIDVTWSDVVRIESDKPIRLQLVGGRQEFGELPVSGSDGVIFLQRGREVLEIPIPQVVTLVPVRVDQTFLQRIRGSIKLGLDYTQSTDIGRATLGGNAIFRERTYQVSSNLNANITSRGDGTDRTRLRLDANYWKFRPNRWFWSATAAVERNDELGIDQRLLAGAGFGRFLRQTSTQEFSIGGGLTVNSEDRAGSGRSSELEAVVGMDWRIYKFNRPETDLVSSLVLYPGLTQSGRLRSNLDITLKQELFADLFWDISFYRTADNKPPEGASKTDFGIVTSLGYNF